MSGQKRAEARYGQRSALRMRPPVQASAGGASWGFHIMWRAHVARDSQTVSLDAEGSRLVNRA